MKNNVAHGAMDSGLCGRRYEQLNERRSIMIDKGGMPMYPAIVFAAVTAFAWAVAIFASYADDKPADRDGSSGKKEREAA